MRRRAKPPVVRVRPRIRFTCPFCGRFAVVIESQTHGGRPGVLHETPMCERFDRLDVVEYLKAVNDEIGRRRGVGIG